MKYLRMKKYIFFLFLFFQGMLHAATYTVDNIPNPHASDITNFVSNPDGILSSQTVSRINQVLQSLEADTKAEVAVVAVNSIGTEDIGYFGVELFKKWGIGKKESDYGLLILFVLDQRNIRFETGYGLEGVLPDAICKRIQTQAMLPEFRKGNYNAGMLAGVEQVASVIRKEPIPEKEITPIAWNEIIPIALAAYSVLALLACYWVNRSAVKVKKESHFKTNIDRYTALKRKTYNLIAFLFLIIAFLILFLFFFFEPVYWLLLLPVPVAFAPAFVYLRIVMWKARRKPIPCDVCGHMMHMLSERKEDKYLAMSQQFEEKLGSVDYDVFLCDQCQNETIFTLDEPSFYTKCPRCKTKAFGVEKTRTMVAPTFMNAGISRTTYKCKFCGYEENKNTTLPRLRNTAGPIIAGGVAGRSFSSGQGGFGGGSFGGGRSGGGGATSGW